MSLSKTKNVEILGKPGVARQLTAGATSSGAYFSDNVFRISMRAVGADIRFVIGQGTQTADASTSHFIADGERLDFLSLMELISPLFGMPRLMAFSK